MRWFVISVVLLVGISACNRDRTRVRAQRPDATASEIVSLPDLDKVPVSEAGRTAIGDVARAHAFGGSAVGVAGTPTPPVRALRRLWKEPNATDAFLYVMKHGTTAGKLFALSGLYYSDPAAFSRELPSVRAIRADVPVLRNGCAPGGDPTPVSQVIEKPGAVRLSGKSDSLAAWSARNPGQPIAFDIVGGGFPDMFRERAAPAP